ETRVPELVKLYYRIGEVSKIVGVAPHVLRYWETEFRSIRPQKSTRGQRVYSRRDVQKLLHVKDLLKNQGFTIAGAKKRLRPSAADGQAGSAGLVSPLAADASAVPAVDQGKDSFASETVSDAKGMRRALVGIRKELVSW